MSDVSRQRSLTALFEQTRLAVRDFAASRSTAEQAAASGAGQWSAAQLLTAITFWLDYTVERVGYFDRGDTPPREVDFEGVQNAALVSHAGDPWPERVAAFERAMDDLIVWVASASDGDLERANYYGDGPGGPLWGEVQANGFIWPLQELEKYYQRVGDGERGATARRLLIPVVGEEERIVCDLVDPETLERLRAENEVVVIDVRDSRDYARGHVAGARHIPLADLPDALAALPADQTLITYCNMHHPGQSRGERAAALLADRGLHAAAIAGGFPAYEESGQPVERE